MAGEERPSLPPLTVRHWFFIIQIFEQLSCPEKQSCSETFHCVEIFFTFQDFWATCARSEKQSVPWIHCIEYIYIFLIIQNFEQLAHALKNRVSLKFFTALKYFLSFRIFEELAFAMRTEFVMKFFTVFNIPFAFRMFEQLLLALKNRACPEFTVLNIYFLSIRILNNLLLPWKTEFALNFFTVLKYFLSFQDFWATWAWPENRVCPEIFKPRGMPPPRPPASYATES